ERGPRPKKAGQPKFQKTDRRRSRKGQKGKQHRDRARDAEALPREDFGRKRGGKRVLGPPDEGRGPAGEKGGNFRFRPKKKGKKGQPVKNEGGRSGGRRGESRNQGPPPHAPSKGMHAPSKGKRKGRR